MLKDIIWDKGDWEDFSLIPNMKNQIDLSNVVTVRETFVYQLSINILYTEWLIASKPACQMIKKWPGVEFG